MGAGETAAAQTEVGAGYTGEAGDLKGDQNSGTLHTNKRDLA